MSKVIKILHVIGQLEYGGVVTWLQTLIAQGQGNGFQFDICCNYRKGVGPLAHEFDKFGCKIYHCPLDFNLISYNSHLKKIIAENNYDIIHDHRSVLSGATLRAAAKAGTPVRISFHHTPDDELVQGVIRNIYYKLLRMWTAKYATHIWGCSKTAMVGQYGENWEKDDVRRSVVYASVHPPTPNYNARVILRKSLSIPEKSPVIGFIGRTNYQKNSVVATEICIQLVDRNKELCVIWAGDGPLLNTVKKMVHDAEFDDNFRFLGFRKDIPDILDTIDLLLQPSLFEGFPLTTLEALYMGLPVVGSTTSGLLEALPKEMHDLCSAPDNTNAFVNTITKLISSPIIRNVPYEFLKDITPEGFYFRMKDKYLDCLSKLRKQ